MRSPIVAMLWENWRITRVEAGLRTVQTFVAAFGAVLLFDAGATVVFWILLVGNVFIWFSVAKLNGGRFMDGYKPGFPLYLLYTRPVSTRVLIGVTMAYDALSCVAMYLVFTALLGFAFGQSLPLFSMVVYLVACHFTYFCAQYATTSRVVQYGGSMVAGIPLFILLRERVSTPLHVEFSLAENAVMILLCVVSYVLTVIGVARQRRGDAVAIVPQPKSNSGGYPEWLVDLFRFPCPTSSATRAQVWFELKSSGLPVLAIGLSMAVMIFLLYVLGIFIESARPIAVAAPFVFGLPALLLFLGGNAFGIRRKQGRTYVSAFEATQPYGTAQLAGVKMLVRTACLVTAITAVGLSAWASSSLMGAWGSWLVDNGKDAAEGLLKSRREIGDSIGGMMGYAGAALAVVALIGVAQWVATLAAFKALRARYPRRVLIAGSLLLFLGIWLVGFATAVQHGMGSPQLLANTLRATGWIALAAIVAMAIYLLWSGFADRALTIRYLCGALLVSVAFAAAGMTLLFAAGERFDDMTASDALTALLLVLLPLIPSVLAPWSLNRIRHA